MSQTTSDKVQDEPMKELLNQPPDQLPDQLSEQPTEHQSASLPKLSSRGWGLVLGGLVLLVGGAWGVLQLTQSSRSPEDSAGPVISVKAMEVHAQPFASTLELSGTIRPVEQAVLSTRVMGRITELSLEAGDRFQQGDVLAQIDVMDIAAQVNQAQAGVVQAQAVVAQTRAELSRSQATLSQLEAQKLEAQAALNLAILEQKRMANLRAEGAVSQERLDQATTALTQAKARVSQVNAGIEQAQAAINQSQAAIDQSNAAVSQASSGVTSAAVSESYGTVIAPFDGVVVQKLAYAGEMASPGTPLLKIENPNRLQLEISVPESNLRYVRVGQSVQVQVEAVGRTFKAAIQQIVPTADPSSRSFLVKIPINGSGQLISGMFGRIVLPVGKPQETILIPTSALIQRGQLQGVYVVAATDDQSIAVLRWVKTGKEQNGNVEITSGLMEGDRLITEQVNQLSDGERVEVMR